MSVRNLMNAVIYTVAVFAATVAVQIYQPATGGYFNLGEAVIYLAALTTSPIVAGIAGGVGAALADAATGYSIFAPATLVIKFAEGCVAGYLVRRFGGSGKERALSFLVGGTYTLLLIYFAAVLWSGEIYVGPEQFLGTTVETPLISIPLAAWVLIALIIGGALTYSLLKRYVAVAEAPLLLASGLIMVMGYFLYEYFVSNPLTNRPPVDAIAEVPVNIGQAVIGAALAVPIAAWLRRAGYAETGD